MSKTYLGEDLADDNSPDLTQDIIRVEEERPDEFSTLSNISLEDSHLLQDQIRLLSKLKASQPARYTKFIDRYHGTVGYKGLDAAVNKFLVKVRKDLQTKRTQRIVEEELSRAREDGKVPVDAEAPVDMARAFMGSERPNLIHTSEEWVDFGGNCYITVEDGEVRSGVYTFLGKCVSVRNGRPVKPNRVLVSNVMDALQALAFQRATEGGRRPRWLEQEAGDPDPLHLVACANTLIDVTTEKTYPLTPRLFTRNGLPFDYVDYWLAGGPPTQWLKFLRQVWPGADGHENVRELQKLFGLLLTADTSYQKLFILVGPPRCGKGTIGRVLIALLGHLNVASPSITTLGQQFGMEQLLGKTLMLVSDMRLGMRDNTAAITEKLLNITGEDSGSINRKFKSAEQGKLDTRIVLLSNDMLNLRDMSGATLSRLHPLVINTSALGKEDRHLSDRLLTELPAILNWAIEGRKKLEREGFILPARSRRLLLATAKATAPIHEFIKDWCDRDSEANDHGYLIQKSKLFNAYDAWCRDVGISNKHTEATFGRELPSASGFIVESGRRRVDGKPQHVYLGLRLKPDFVEVAMSVETEEA